MESVIISGVHNINNLGVIRGLGEKGIPITLLDVDAHSMTRYSRFVSKRLRCPDIWCSEDAFVNFLVEYGRHLDHSPMLLPTGDAEVLAFSRHRDLLEPYYRIPQAHPDAVELLVNKKRFFLEMSLRNIPYPRSWFPESIDEARHMAARIVYPFVVKAAYSHEFIRRFHNKVFVVHSLPEFEAALQLLHDAKQDYFLQEIIPGDSLFLVYLYFNRQSEPLGICGYDKIRQLPKDFGIGTICRSINRPAPIQTAIQFLKDIGYHGLAEAEFKRDPRDGQYKMIEINTRSVTQTLLAKTCGVHMEYLAYLEMTGRNPEPLAPAAEGILWMDDISELHYCLGRLRRRIFSMSDIPNLFQEKPVFACASVSDPAPMIIGLKRFFHERLVSLRNHPD